MSSSVMNSKSAGTPQQLENVDERPQAVPAISTGAKKPAQSAYEEIMPGKEQATSAPAKVGSVDEEQIRQLAYRLYEQRGREDGHAVEDWIEAEATLRSA
jgi:hypothetical protein